MLKTIFSYVGKCLRFLFCGKKKGQVKVSSPKSHSFNGAHDCGIRALLAVVPDIPDEQIQKTFMHCADKWPYAGISDKEFNISLRHLKLFDRFTYECEGTSIEQLKQDAKNTYIALIPGHYTVVHESKVIDSDYNQGLPNNTKVIASWKLIR